MRRRRFLALLGSAPLATRPVRAQGTMPVVGFLNPALPETCAFNVAAFRDGLAKAGFVEGRNVRIEYGWGKGDCSKLPAMAAELAALKVAAIAATGDIASAQAAQAATGTIPIVFTIGADRSRRSSRWCSRPASSWSSIARLQPRSGSIRLRAC